jgi:hypothetical protein
MLLYYKRWVLPNVYIHKCVFQHLINQFYHISFDPMVDFTDSMVEINLCMIQDLFQLCTIEFGLKSEPNITIS